MKIAFVADVHLGNHKRFGGALVGGVNTRFTDTLTVLEKAYAYAFDQGCEHFVVLGDLFDTSRPSPQEIAQTMAALHAQEGWPAVLVLAGNHDIVSDQPGDHALAPLAEGGIHVVASSNYRLEDTQYVGESPRVLFVPFETGNSTETFTNALSAAAKDSWRPHLVAAHFGVMDADTPAFLRTSADAVAFEVCVAQMREHRVQYLMVGNWHNFDTWQFSSDHRTSHFIVQVGALVPTGFDNPGMNYGNIAVVDVGSDKPPSFHRLPGPRFFSATLEDLTNAAWLAQLHPRNKNYLRVTCAPKNFPDAQALAEQLKEKRLVVLYELRADRTEGLRAAETAAAVTSSQVTIADAVAAYCAKAAFPAEVDRGVVLSLVQRFLTE